MHVCFAVLYSYLVFERALNIHYQSYNIFNRLTETLAHCFRGNAIQQILNRKYRGTREITKISNSGVLTGNFTDNSSWLNEVFLSSWGIWPGITTVTPNGATIKRRPHIFKFEDKHNMRHGM